ncbi:predicted membrane protein [Hahella chejuensis KCTC 2396]|uniref:Predicted membrane protein n=1 Tax=Hahella chejuensis (strain KCTC 2396) TaxID=349521 RepID=Q2SA72_HAHCH|nr:DUF2214 family protein [Hahella chejuensis]ABC32452.1 predicted membrane protein [Hahella chejuensis KCTC 2396]
MLVPIALSWLHFICIFALVSLLLQERKILSMNWSLDAAKALLATDRWFGLSAMTVLASGFARVFFEKGEAYYFSNFFFWSKLALFITAGLISLYPTIQFLRWRKSIQAGQTPEFGADDRRRVTRAIHAQMLLVLLIPLCAVLMARGYG